MLMRQQGRDIPQAQRSREARKCRCSKEDRILRRHRDNPAHFPESNKQWLGDMLRGIGDATDDHAIAELKPNYDDRTSANGYTKRDHHGSNTVFNQRSQWKPRNRDGG